MAVASLPGASLHPSPAWPSAVRASRGAFVSQSAVRAALPDARHDFTQTAWGVDVEYSADYSRSTRDRRQPLDVAGCAGADDRTALSAIATSAEGRYKIRPGLYLAARFDHLGFSEVEGSTGRRSWEAPVNRWEVGVIPAAQSGAEAGVSAQYADGAESRTSISHRPGGVLALTNEARRPNTQGLWNRNDCRHRQEAGGVRGMRRSVLPTLAAVLFVAVPSMPAGRCTRSGTIRGGASTCAYLPSS